ncbi:MAG: hypothetical protein ACXIT4_12200 [Erythrobacter sp.]
MNAPARLTEIAGHGACVFGHSARARFAAHYPETPHILRHNLTAHPLLEIGALAELAEMLPDASVEYNHGDLPIGVDGRPDAAQRRLDLNVKAPHGVAHGRKTDE